VLYTVAEVTARAADL